MWLLRHRWLWATTLAASVAVMWVIWLTDIPLGIPGEWTWERSEPDAALWPTVLFPLLIAAGYVAIVRVGWRRIDSSTRGQRAGWLAGLVAGGFLWLWSVQECASQPFQLSKAVWVLYFPSSSGYFTEARQSQLTWQEYLAGYEERIATMSRDAHAGDATARRELLHLGTHPPGLVMGYRALIALCEWSPTLTSAVLWTQPDSLRESFADAFEHLPAADRAVLWLSSLIVQLVAVLTVCPLYRLLRRDHSPRASWLTTSFWPTIPALALFLPKSDALYPYLGMLFLWLWLEGRARRSTTMCVAAGAVLWVGMCLSLALLPVAVLAAVVTAWEIFVQKKPGFLGKSGLLTGVGFVVPCLFVWLILDISLAGVWIWNYLNHAAFYEFYQRNYWKWLLANPMELAVALGPPLTILAVWSFARAVRSIGLDSSRQSNGMIYATAIVWGLLHLSGKNMGEAARLWLVIMPWFVCVVAPLFDESPAEKDANGINTWTAILIVQMLVTLALATRVVGFHLPMPVQSL